MWITNNQFKTITKYTIFVFGEVMTMLNEKKIQ